MEDQSRRREKRVVKGVILRRQDYVIVNCHVLRWLGEEQLEDDAVRPQIRKNEYQNYQWVVFEHVFVRKLPKIEER